MTLLSRASCLLALILLPLTTVAGSDPVIDPILTETNESVLPSNPPSDTSANLQITLELAHHQRDERDYESATKTLVSILDSDAPEHFKRTALLDLALTKQQASQPAQALQIFGQYVSRYSDDPGVPEVLLREGLLYRQTGAQGMALSKFYAVMTTILNLKLDTSGYYQRLVLQAQTEIAETYYQQGKFSEATDFFERLLKLDLSTASKEEIRLKFIRCLAASAKHQEVVENAKELLTDNPDSPEVRFLLAISLRELGRRDESLRQVVFLLDSPAAKSWKQTVGNQIANDFYGHGDYTNALVIYQHLAEADPSPEWQIPALYQVGVVCERLQQFDKATAAYSRALQSGSTLGENTDPNLRVVLDIASWRKEYLAWQSRAQQANQSFHPPPLTPVPTSSK